MSKGKPQKTDKNDRLLQDVLGQTMYRRMIKRCENCQCVDLIMDQMDREMEKLI